ncbi:MAG TPA: DUF4175 family protein [Verrucomicrobiota bacterium]|nr:hypothetical protein [Verrucomicrobiales bacterium]HRI15558.1 DUF4175 family protein [Verrucomicrobiota bacterium]
MNTPSPIRDQLALAGRARDHAVRLATGLTVIGLLALVLLTVALVDYGLILPASARWAAVALMAIVLIAGLGRVIWLRRRPTSLKASALEVEAARPSAGCEVSTAAEYATGERKISQEYEHELVAALQQRASATVAQTSLPHGRRLILPALIVAGVVGALGAFLISAPAAGTALKRTMAPWSKAPFSQVKVTPGAAEVPVGRPLEIASEFSGRQPERAEIQIREEGRNEWTSVPLTASTNGSFRHLIPAVNASFAYRVVGLDAVSDEFPVTSYVPPDVKDLRVRLQPPAYTGLKPLEQATADITIVRGSQATFRVTPTVPLSKAQLRFTNGMVLELKPNTAQQWAAQLPVVKDDEFRFELFDAKGRRGGDEQVHHVTAVPDAPPKVDFTTPGQDIRAAATNRVALKLTASDDFGLAGVKIIYHRLGAPEQELAAEVTAKKDNEVEAEAELDLSLLKLHEFELVAYHAEARDNNTLDGPGIGHSPTYFIEITDLEAGKCLSQTQGQKVNLLVIQKQIIADTAAVAAKATEDKFKELAARQKDALEFGKMYQQALTKTGAPLPAQGAMNSAVAAMEKAVTALQSQKREAALAPEESALASLYQVVGLMPQLQSLPTVPPPVAQKSPTNNPPALNVVLEAIKKQKKEPPNQQEMAQALAQIQELRRQQAGLNAAGQDPGRNSSESQATSNPSKSAGQKGNGSNGKGEKGTGQKGSGQKASGTGEKGQGEKRNGQKGSGEKPEQESKPTENQENKEENENQDTELAKLAPKQEQLSKEAKEIAERLARAAGKGSRRGHGAGQRMSDAAAKMGQAAQAMRSGNSELAGTAGDQSASSLGAAAAMLESLLSGKPELSDVSAEEAPKQYEGAIADYFKRLSHAE